MTLLADVKVEVADLPDGLLGLASGNTIQLDRDAAGYGWFIDSTPWLDEEYSTTVGERKLTAVDPQAVDRIDLLTVLEHELGHMLGLDDLDAATDALMSSVLAAGVRRV